jgi:hypothetical protein
VGVNCFNKRFVAKSRMGGSGMDRKIKPYEQVKAMLGSASSAWEKLVGHIRFYYVMDEKWDKGKATHKNYNNLFIRRGGKSLVMLGIREGYFIACIVLGKEEREKFAEQRDSFDEAVRAKFDEAEAYHDGTWLAFEIHDESLVDDMIRLIRLKRKPNRKILPDSSEKCGSLDLGMTHAEITNCLFAYSTSNI